MAVATTEAGVLRTGNGVVVEFAFPFRAQVASDIKVASVVGQVLTVLSPATYTVLLAAASGTVTFGIAPLNGAVIYIYRETAQTQVVSVSSQNAYNPTVVEGVWDKLTLIAQELSAALIRTVKVAPGGNADTLVSQIFATQAAAAASAADADADRIAAAASAAAAATFVPANFFDKASLLSGLSAPDSVTAQTNLGITDKGRALAASVTSLAFTAGTDAQGQGVIPVDTSIVLITMAAASPSGATLPVATVTGEMHVFNLTANAVNVYPVSGSTIGTAAVNVPFAILPGQSALFLGQSATAWRVASLSGDTRLTKVVALANAAATLTAAQLVVDKLFTITPTVARTLTTATAVEIIAALSGAPVGASVAFTIVNLGSFNVTLAAGAGVTLSGQTVINDGSGVWRVVITGAATVTIFNEAATAPQPLGVGQTWQNLLASRAAGTSYQNTTGRPIQLSVSLQSNAHFLQVSTNNATWITVGTGAENGSDRNTISVVVPDTHYYRVTTGGALVSWAELR